MLNKVTVKVPATSANLGPGFDIAGMALDIHNVISFSVEGNRLEIQGCPEKYANKGNLAYVGFSRTLQEYGIEGPAGLKIEIESDIPISRGMGSSSALIVAGICAAKELFKINMSKFDMLKIATAIEGHPDNAAPCIFGGFVSSWLNNGECYEIQNSISEKLRFALLIPDYKIKTEDARAILPESIKRTDAVFSVAHYSLLVNGFASGNGRILKEALDDRIHQPYRKSLIKNFDEYHNIAMSCGAYGLVISGSGSTMLIVGDEQTDFDKIKTSVISIEESIDFRLTQSCLEGATCQTSI